MLKFTDSELAISLDIPFGLVLLTVQNQTDGITLITTPSCPPAAALTCTPSQSHTIPNVSLPKECNSGNCKDILVINDNDNANSVQYIIVIPVVRGVLLLNFEYRSDTQHLVLKEQSVVDSSGFNCDPMSSARLGAAYYTLCIDSSSERLSFNVLVLENVRNISEAVFSPRSVLDEMVPIDFYPSDILWIDLSVYDTENPYKLIVGAGTNLYVVNLERSHDYSISFLECTVTIAQLQPIPQLEQLVYYLLVYCQTNYGYADIDNEDETNVIGVDDYTTGYPIVCPGVSSPLNITNNGTQSFLQYNAKCIPLTGEAIILNESVCFGNRTNKQLFYLYTDLELGVFVLDLENDKLSNISMNTCPTGRIDSCSLLKDFEQRYILLEETLSSSMNLTSKLKLFDVLESEVVSITNVDYSYDIVLVLKLPPTPTDQSALIIGSSVAAAIVIVLAIIIIIILLVVGYTR